MTPLYLTASALVTALGRGLPANLAALRAVRSGLIAWDFGDVTLGGYVGRVPVL